MVVTAVVMQICFHMIRTKQRKPFSKYHSAAFVNVFAHWVVQMGGVSHVVARVRVDCLVAEDQREEKRTDGVLPGLCFR